MSVAVEGGLVGGVDAVGPEGRVRGRGQARRDRQGASRENRTTRSREGGEAGKR